MSLRIARILLPTDFSEVALPALDYAVSLSGMLKADLHCLHVVDDAYQYWSAIGPESLPIGPPPDELVELGRKRMERFRTEHLAGIKPAPQVQVAYGRPFAEIISYARDHAIDIIVMGTHGRGAIAQVLLGSTTEKVVRKAPCAVLTVRAKDHQFTMP